MILDPSFMLNSGQKLENDFEMDLDVMSALKTRKWSAEKPRPIQSCLEKWASGEGGREKNEMNGSGRTSYAFATFYFSTRGHEANIERCSDWLNLRDGNLGVIIVFAFFWMSDVFHLKTIKQQNKAKSNSCLARQCFFFLLFFSPSKSPGYQRRAQQSQNFWWFSD